MIRNSLSLKGIIFAIVLLAVAGGLCLSLWWWIDSSLIKIAEENSNLTTLQADTLQRAKVLSLASETAEAREIVGGYFINTDTLAEFIGQIENMARETGAELTINQAVTGERVFLEMYAEGAFSELMNFIHLIESMPFQAQITKLALTKNSVSDDKKMVRWSVAISLNLISFEK